MVCSYISLVVRMVSTSVKKVVFKESNTTEGFSKSELSAWADYERSFGEAVPKLDVHSGFWSFGDYELVGHGKVTDSSCGKFLGFRGCARTELHDKTTLDGVNYSGKVFVRKVHCTCHKPTCPICYKHGWAVREAKMIETRLVECSKRFGQVEHIILSVPKLDYRLTLESLRSKAVHAVMKNRGIVGGVLIFHAFRYRNRDILLKGVFCPRGWYLSPHFHVLGYIMGGYGECRSCKFAENETFAECRGCAGFEGRTRRCFDKDGYIVKVKGKRKSVIGTAWYQLNHASVKRGVERFRVETWFGICSYRKLKVTSELRKEVCPICQHDLERLRYVGVKSFICDKSSPKYNQDTFENACEDGCVVWSAFELERSWQR